MAVIPHNDMIIVERFVNQLMSSNCYMVVDGGTKHSICVDPASEKSEREIQFIEQNNLSLDYIFLTHEHTDHTWGVNALIEKYPSVKVICSETCKVALPKEAKSYFQFYYDDPDYVYNVKRVDCTTEDLGGELKWLEHRVLFVPTPGHSPGSVCIVIGDIIFGGDTLMPFKPFIKKRNGGSLKQFQDSVIKMVKSFPGDFCVYPGHGEKGKIQDYCM